MKHAFLRFPNFYKKALTLSYDDGAKFDERLVEIFNKYNLKATFNLPSGLMQTSDTWRMSLDEAVKLYKTGDHEVAIHGLKHLSLFDIPEHCAIDEVLQDKKNLEKATGKIIRGMAYSYGFYDARVIELLKKLDIRYARTVLESENFDICENFLELKPTCHHNNPKLFDFLEEFKKDEKSEFFFRNRPKLFYMWGHSHEFPKDDNWDRIEKFCELASNLDGVWYATNIEIFDYIYAYEQLIFSTLCDKVYNPSAIDVYIDYYGKEYLIPAGKEIELK